MAEKKSLLERLRDMLLKPFGRSKTQPPQSGRHGSSSSALKARRAKGGAQKPRDAEGVGAKRQRADEDTGTTAGKGVPPGHRARGKSKPGRSKRK